MTFRPVGAAAVLVLGLALSPLAGANAAERQTIQGLPTEVALVVPLTVPASTTGLIPADLLADYTSPTGHLTRALDQLENRPVTIAIDPMIIASIRVLGTSAPASSVTWLERLAAASNETFALAWADSNLTLGLAAGSATVLAPGSLEFAIDPGLFGAAEAAPTGEPNPEETADVDAAATPALPSSDDLLEWDYRLPSVGWPATDSVTPTTFAALAASYEYTLLASSNLSGLGALESTANVDNARVLVSDSALSTVFSTTVSAVSVADWQQAVAVLEVQFAAAARQPSASSAIVTLDRAARASDPELGATIDAIDALAEVALVGVSAVANNSAPTATIADLPQDAAAAQLVKELLELEVLDAAFAEIAVDPSLITSERRLDLLAVLSNSWTTSAQSWTTATDSYAAASTALRESVKIVKSSSITLWADRASLPVIVKNDLNQPVTVYITVRPLTPLIRVEDSYFDVEVEPNSERKALVPVQSISNGVVALEISLHTLTGEEIGNTTYVKTTVQAGWETPFTIGAGIVVMLIFAGGIVRTILRRNRARASEVTIA